MKTTKTTSLILVLVVSVFFLGKNTTMAEEKSLRAAGCKTEYFLIKELAEAYSNTTGNKLLPGPTGNKKAVQLLLDQKIDLTFTCKPIDKLTKGLKLNPDDVSAWKSIAIAKDPVVVVSNSKNGVQNITTEQLTKLFQGEITTWKELGGTDLNVKTAYMNPQLESGVVLLFKEFTVGSNGKLDEKAMIGDGPSILGNYVSVTPGAVTFMAFNSYREKYGDILKVDGVPPTRENILNGSYGLAATYYLTLDSRNIEGVNKFVDYSTSAEGKTVIDQNFISISQ